MCLHPHAVCPSLQPGARGPPPAALQAVGSLSVHLSGEQTLGLLTPLGARLGRKCGVGEVACKGGVGVTAAAAAHSASASSSSSGTLETGGGE